MSFLVMLTSILFPSGTNRGKKWADAMKAIAEANAAKKIAEEAKKRAEEAEKRAEDAFLALPRVQQVQIIHAAWMVEATELARAKAKFGSKNGDGAMENGSKKERKVTFESEEPIPTEVHPWLFQSSDPTWKFEKRKFSPFSPDMQYLVGPEMALLRAAQLAEELSR